MEQERQMDHSVGEQQADAPSEKQASDKGTVRIPESTGGMAKLAVLLLAGQILLTLIGLAAAVVAGIEIWKIIQG